MLPNEMWPRTINDLLWGGDRERSRARDTMWREVDDYVVHRARLPIGRLGDDEEERRNISVRVLRTLELNDYAHVREWERRQLQGRDAAPWWGFIKLVTSHRAIEYARTSRLNIARRSDGFDWAIVEPADPHVLAETMPSAAGCIARCEWFELVDFLDRLNRSRALTNEPALPPEPPPARASQTTIRRPGSQDR